MELEITHNKTVSYDLYKSIQAMTINTMIGQ